jgi:hypothetical protein
MRTEKPIYEEQFPFAVKIKKPIGNYQIWLVAAKNEREAKEFVKKYFNLPRISSKVIKLEKLVDLRFVPGLIKIPKVLNHKYPHLIPWPQIGE